MDFHLLTTAYGIYLSTLIVCLVSGFVPVINAESYLILVSALAPMHTAIGIILIAVASQMLAKSVLYLAGRGTLKLNLARYQEKIDRLLQKFQKWEKKADLFIFISASSGFPPFYLVSILAGFLKLRFWRFFVYGFAGRLVRFSVVVLFPQLIKELLH